MFGTLVLTAILANAPAQGGLNLVNVRATYGELGPVRTDDKYMPGDLFFVAFDIEGLTISPEGKVSYKMSMEVTDKAGKVAYKPEKEAEREELLPLGGTRLPGRVFVMLKLDQEPGQYTCKLTVVDRASNASKVLEHRFQVVPKEFGILFFYLTSDPEGSSPMPPSGVIGQNLFVHCNLLTFGRGADKKPNAMVELRVFDEAKKPTIAKPVSAQVPKEAPDGEPVIFRFQIPFNREGNFTAELKATDNVTGKVATMTFPIKVAGR